LRSYFERGYLLMYTINPWHLAVFVITLGASSIAAGQATTLSTTPLATLPTVSNERLGTGVPSRLPKADVQRPVFTIQSGGPVALPMPQFRPTREVTLTATPATEAKGSLPIIEQTRPWLKSGDENKTASPRALPTLPQARPVASSSTLPGVRPAATALTSQSPQLTAELSTTVRRTPTTGTQMPQPVQTRPTAAPTPASQTPARVLNFSIN
jgi:hypothetical protein